MDGTSEIRLGHFTRRNAIGITPSLPSPEKRLRMVVLGASGVGKTQLVSRFIGRPFSGAYLPTAEDFHRKKITIKGHTYQLDILDTAGHTSSPVMRNLTLLTGDLFLVVYSIADRGSWQRAMEFVASIEEVTRDPIRTNKYMELSFRNLLSANGGTSFQSDKFTNGIQGKKHHHHQHQVQKVPILLVGNKCDLPNTQVQSFEVMDWMRQRPYNPSSIVNHISVSAKTDESIQEMFDYFFAMSNLPLELSPNMHRNVSENEFAVNSAIVGDKRGNRFDDRPRSAEYALTQRQQHRPSLCKKTIHLRTMPGCQSSGGSCSSSDSEENEGVSTNATATICSNQRRPSIDTEVLLAFSKLRTYTSPSSKKREHSSAVEKLRKRINKFKHI